MTNKINFDQPTYKPSNLTLSNRQKQIVRLIQQAKSNKQIAFELALTDGTVKEYIYQLFRKLGVTNRTELALWGFDNQNVLAPSPDSVAA